jgi:hypothetical protein
MQSCSCSSFESHLPRTTHFKTLVWYLAPPSSKSSIDQTATEVKQIKSTIQHTNHQANVAHSIDTAASTMTSPKDTNIGMEIDDELKYETVMEDPNEEDGISSNASMVDQVEGHPISPHDWNIEMEISDDQKYDTAKADFDEKDGMSSNTSMVDQFEEAPADNDDGFTSRPLSNAQLASNYNEAVDEDAEMAIRTKYPRSPSVLDTPSPESAEDTSPPEGHAAAAIGPSMTEHIVTVAYETIETRKNPSKIKQQSFREIKISDLKKFSKEFSLNTPVPADIAAIVKKEPVKEKELEEESIPDNAGTALDPGASPSSGATLESTAHSKIEVLIAKGAEKVDAQLEIKRVPKTTITMEETPSFEQPIRESQSTMDTDQPREVEQSTRYPLLAMATKNALRVMPSFPNPQPSMSTYTQVLLVPTNKTIIMGHQRLFLSSPPEYHSRLIAAHTSAMLSVATTASTLVIDGCTVQILVSIVASSIMAI